MREESIKYFHFKNCHLSLLLKFRQIASGILTGGHKLLKTFGIVKTRTPTRYLPSSYKSVLKMFGKYVVLPQNSGNLNRAPEPVVVCPSATRCGWQYAL